MKVLIDNGHGSNTKGKCSPDGRLREYAWARACAFLLADVLKAKGIDAELVVPEEWDVSLQTRVGRVNTICRKAGAKNCVLVSLHNNAAGADGKWHDASGWSVFVSKNASENSKRLARLMTAEAMRRDMLGNRSVPAAKYWTWSWTKSDIYLLKMTNCPAVLTENFFQDHKVDVDYLLSDAGMTEVVDMHVAAIERYIKGASV